MLHKSEIYVDSFCQIIDDEKKEGEKKSEEELEKTAKGRGRSKTKKAVTFKSTKKESKTANAEILLNRVKGDFKSLAPSERKAIVQAYNKINGKNKRVESVKHGEIEQYVEQDANGKWRIKLEV